MARLPVPGGDEGVWGNILNEFLLEEHNQDGSLRRAGDVNDALANAQSALTEAQNALTAAQNAQTSANNRYQLPTGGVPESDLASVVQQKLNATPPNADASTLGLVRLNGDLSGTANNPTVPSLNSKADMSDITVRRIYHGGDASFARPSGDYLGIWVGWETPDNLAPGDIYQEINEQDGATAPDTPTGFQVSGGDSLVDIEWNTVSGATAYHLQRSSNGGSSWTTLSSNAESPYQDTDVTNGVEYWYRVRASNVAGSSDWTTAASVTPMTIPSAPSNVQATAGDGSVGLSWDSVNGADTYTVKRATSSGGPYTAIEGGISGTSFTDSSVSNGTTYYYVVSATNALGEGPDSSEVSAMPEAPEPGTLDAPTDLSIEVSETQNNISWASVSGADTYNVQRATSVNGTFTTIESGVSGTNYTDTSITANAGSASFTNLSNYYYYRVIAVSGSEESSPSIVLGSQPRDGGHGEAFFWLDPVYTTAADSTIATYTLLIDTGSDEIDTAQARISFDPNHLEFVQADDSNSDFNIFDASLNDSGTGYVEVVVANISALSGQLTMLTIDFSVSGPAGATMPKFDMSRTAILRAGNGLSIGTRGSRIDISN